MVAEYLKENLQEIRYKAGSDKRRAVVREKKILNGIDFLEVSPDQKTIRVHFIHNLPGLANALVLNRPLLTEDNVVIQGGVSVKNIVVESATSFNNVLTLRLNTSGDKFYKYILKLVDIGDKNQEVLGFDPQLSSVEFSFRADNISEFDCQHVPELTLEKTATPPVIDYLAKDYASFRKLILDRLTVTMPEWRERNPSDIGIMLVELLAYAGDRLSYFQDAVATEAYLGTARRRVSIRRHARLLDYPMHDGCNARAWVALEVTKQGDRKVLQGPTKERSGSKFFTKVMTRNLTGDLSSLESATLMANGVQIFETMHDITLYRSHNIIKFYTWDNQEFYLKKGETKATLENNSLRLKVGDILIFEELRGRDTGKSLDAEPSNRHVVRLTKVTPQKDPLYDKDLLEIEWAAADALPFSLCISKLVDDKVIANASIARGNVVLVDNGCTVSEELQVVSDTGYLRPKLQFKPLTQQAYTGNRKYPFQAKAPASDALRWEMRYILPQIRLEEGNRGKESFFESSKRWKPQRDLLNSDSFAREFVVEIEDDSSAYLRFGDGVLGKEPERGIKFKAIYRIGNGVNGNVAAEAIQEIEQKYQSWVMRVRNPLPARGGVEPEPLEQVRLYAPQAFRTQKRAVTEGDYGVIAQNFPGVRKAIATRKWTGSWYTMFITVDREGGLPVDSDFKRSLAAFLESFRLVGQDIQIDAPVFVPLDIAMVVRVGRDYFPSQVKAQLLDVFSSKVLRSGQLGFFHPDNFTFAQPVYLSQVIATAMGVAGVVSVKVEKFQRWNLASQNQDPQREINEGQIPLGNLEIAQLENDPNAPHKGNIEFLMEGT